MKLLQEIYKTFVLLGICPPYKPIKQWIKILYGFISGFCLIILFIGTFSSLVFFVKYFTIDLANAICAVYQIFAFAGGIYIFGMAHVKRDNITTIFDHLQTFYDKSKYNKNSYFFMNDFTFFFCFCNFNR